MGQTRLGYMEAEEKMLSPSASFGAVCAGVRWSARLPARGAGLMRPTKAYDLAN